MIKGWEFERFIQLTKSSKEIWGTSGSVLRGWDSGGLEMYSEVEVMI